MNLQERLFELQDLKYKEFHLGIVTTIDPDTVIGVRTPQLRALAKEFVNYSVSRDVTRGAATKGMLVGSAVEEFLADLPHKYYEENQLHAFIISGMKNYNAILHYLELFLPHIDNWATCDQTNPKIFALYRHELIDRIDEWMASDHTYTVRFGIEMLMNYYLDEDFKPEYLDRVASVHSDEYYVNMMCAWYFATALAKQWDAVIPYIEDCRLSDWVHAKSIQKAIESLRITDEQKAYLRTLK